MSLFRHWLLAFLATIFAGCGFHLQGAATVPAEMARTYISAQDRQSIFYRKLRDEFRAVGVEVVDSPVDASSIFNILTDLTGQRVISVSARNVPREFEVFYSVQYSLQSGSLTLMEPRDQFLTRDYTYDETLVLGKASEEEQMRDAIADDLVRIVLIQLSSL